ncbi:hypothetical protein CKO51_12885 [Rhodopirellula sp. SM50]|nr:hypothetical protein CKO51_12885 [Rhodopirellula sp. SM50]
MPRLIRHTADSPLKIPPSTRAQWVCRCGLSQNKPYCDGSHARVRSEDENLLYIYNETTQSKIDSIPDIGPLTTLRPLCASASSPLEHARIRKLRSDAPEFSHVIDLRLQHTSTTPTTDEFDETADHYIQEQNGVPTVTMRVNQARRGELDCESYYPSPVLKMLRPLIGSASRLTKSPLHRGSPKEVFEFVAAVWRDQHLDGMRIDLINVHIPMIPLYNRMGYQIAPHSRFVHPRLQTDSVVMFLVSDPRRKSAISHAFENYFDPASLDAIHSQFPICGCDLRDFALNENHLCPRPN